MKHTLAWIIVCCVALIMTGCTPKTVETEKDPFDTFVLGQNKIMSLLFQNTDNITFNDTQPLTDAVMHYSLWVKTNDVVTNYENLIASMLDDQGFQYYFYAQKEKVLVDINASAQFYSRHYYISKDIYDSLMIFLIENYITMKPGLFDFVKAAWGADDSTIFDINPAYFMDQFNRIARSITVLPEQDLSSYQATFTFIDTQGNLYRFYDQAYTIKLMMVKDGTIKYFNCDFSDISNLWDWLREKYPDKLITNQLSSTLFTQVYLDTIPSSISVKGLPISKDVSDMVNRILMLDKAYKADVMPNAESNCPVTLKNDQGLYYVICNFPYVVGVGTDPGKSLTYYTLFHDPYTGEDLRDYFRDMAIAPPAGSSLATMIFTRAFAMTHSEMDVSVALSSAQNTYLKNLMNLAEHAEVIQDIYPYFTNNPGYYSYTELISLKTSIGHNLYFVVDTATRTVFLSIDYNGDKYGQTYYRIDSSVYNQIIEASLYLNDLISPVKADANPTFNAFYIGDQLNYSKLTDLPMKSMTSDQIKAIDGLLQRSSWKELTYSLVGSTLNSRFVLQKDSTHFYIFSQVGSMSVVSLKNQDGGETDYLIPNSALNDVLNALKLIK